MSDVILFYKKNVKIFVLCVQKFLKKAGFLFPSANGNYGNRVASYSAKRKKNSRISIYRICGGRVYIGGVYVQIITLKFRVC